MIESSVLEAARIILREWSALSGQELCWYHPDYLRRLCVVLSVPPPDGPPDGPKPSRAEFEAGCRAYTEKLYGEPGEYL